MKEENYSHSYVIKKISSPRSPKLRLCDARVWPQSAFRVGFKSVPVQHTDEASKKAQLPCSESIRASTILYAHLSKPQQYLSSQQIGAGMVNGLLSLFQGNLRGQTGTDPRGAELDTTHSASYLLAMTSGGPAVSYPLPLPGSVLLVWVFTQTGMYIHS